MSQNKPSDVLNRGQPVYYDTLSRRNAGVVRTAARIVATSFDR